MSIEDTLRRELHDVTASPPSGRPADTLASGRAGAADAPLAGSRAPVCPGRAVAAAAVVLLPGGGDRRRLRAATAISSGRWRCLPRTSTRDPGLLRAALPPGTELTDVQMKAWPPDDDPDDAEAVGPGVGRRVAAPVIAGTRRWSGQCRSSSATATSFGPICSRARARPRATPRRPAGRPARRLYLVCDVGTDADIRRRDVLPRRVRAPGFGGLVRRPPTRLDPDQLWFSHQVEAQPGGDFLLRMVERVKTPTRAGAEAQQLLDRETMTGLVLDPDLLAAG